MPDIGWKRERFSIREEKMNDNNKTKKNKTKKHQHENGPESSEFSVR